MKIVVQTILLAALASLAACASKPKEAPVRTLSAVLVAAVDANTGEAGIPGPTLVHVLALSDKDALLEADYFALVEDAEGVLGRDVLAVETLSIQPGAEIDLELETPNDAAFIAVVAGLKDYQSGHWRDLEPYEVKKFRRGKKWRIVVEKDAVDLVATKK